MLIARLVFNEAGLDKLARRRIRASEVEQLPRNGAVAVRNPHPRVAGSRLLIGATDGGRLLTIVVDPDAADTAIWLVRTGWDASARERNAYQRGG